MDRGDYDLHQYRISRVSEMSNGAIDAAARRATLPTKFTTSRAAQQNTQASQKKWAISNPAPAAGNSGRQSPSPLKGHAVSPVVNSATNTAPIYARVLWFNIPHNLIEFVHGACTMCSIIS